jgi:signal transduction histidine kinase/ligand-binding sensor domain-containing protein
MRLLIAVALAAFLVEGGAAAHAASWVPEISQHAHAVWTVRAGALKDPVSAIAQTPDGYLWLGTQFGLLRFDGVRHVLWQPPAGQHLPSITIRNLLAASDGTLWIGTQLGLASLKNGRLTVHPEIKGQLVGGMVEDRDGTVWVGTRYPPPAQLCAFRNDRMQCGLDDGVLGVRASSLLEDRAGNLWVGTANALWRWKPGVPERYPLRDFESSGGLVETGNGELLIAERDRLVQLVGGKVVPVGAPLDRVRAQFSQVFRDRYGALWIATFDRGLVHVHDGRIDFFTQADGLSSNYVRDIFEDREGTIWVATGDGLDRFRRHAVTTFTTRQGLSEGTPWSVLAARDGSIWVGTLDGLNRMRDGQITVYRRETKTAGQAPAAREVVRAGLPDNLIQSLYEDRQGRLWISTHGGVAYFENGRFTQVHGVPQGVHAIVADAASNLWISEDAGLIRLAGDRVVEQIPWATLGRRTPASLMLAEPAGGGLWLGFKDGSGMAHFEQGRLVASYDAAHGLGRGILGSLYRDADGTIWVATEGGLSRLRNGRVHTLTAQNGLPCDAVHWVIEDDDHAVWLYTACGLLRLARSELDAWAAAAERGGQPDTDVHPMVLDESDGVRIHASAGGFTPQLAKSGDGRIWFLPWDGVGVIDPRDLPFNRLAPPVHVEQITAGGARYPASSGLQLPPGVRDLTIEYTALTLAVPEKVRFRYKLEGQDRDWKEVGNERRVQYSNLPPGEYHFHVTASNNHGVWNEAGAVLHFAVPPAYYETAWFQALCVLAFMGLLWTAHQLHVLRLVRQFNRTVEVRVAERTRIARDLHDTLLQSFHALLFLFESSMRLLPDHPEEAKQRLARALAHAAEATTEARNAVQGLRSSTHEASDFVQRLANLVQLLTTEHAGASAIAVTTHGVRRPLKPVVADEVYRIAGEALRNAVRHAAADQVTVEIRYDDRRFRVRVLDDGRGFDPQTLRHPRPGGHFGVAGMHERAEMIGATLSVWTKPAYGTSVDLTLPARIAYTRYSRRRLAGIFTRLAPPWRWRAARGPWSDPTPVPGDATEDG